MKDIMETMQALQSTPVPNLLVIAGFILLFLAFVGRIGAVIELPRERQRWAGIIGALLLISGIGLFTVPGSKSDSTSPEIVAITPDTPTATPIPPTSTPVLPTHTPTLEPPTDTPVPEPTITNPLTPTPPSLTCQHPKITSYVFPQLEDITDQHAFYGLPEISQNVFKCEGVRDLFHSVPVAIRVEYQVAQDKSKYGYFGIGTLGGYDATQFSQICFWAYAMLSDQAFWLKIKDTSETEGYIPITVDSTNEWTQFCYPLREFSDQGVDLSQLDNINLGFDEELGSATVWVDDFELKE